MITKERLEELIKQGSTIYGIEFNKVEMYDLSDEDYCISPVNFGEYGLRRFEPLGYWTDIKFKDLFETKEEAEWHREFGCIERTERLELPTWEDLKNCLNRFCYFTDCCGREYCLSYTRATNKLRLRYFVDELDEEDKKSIKKQMIDLELPLRKMARNLGVSSAYLCDVIKGNRYFTPKLKEQFESQGIKLNIEQDCHCVGNKNQKDW